MDTKPSTAYHSLPVRWLNATLPIAGLFGARRTELTEDALLAAARHETGLDGSGDESFRPGLRALLASLRDEAQLNPFGRHFAAARIVRTLKTRLRVDACLAANPEIRARRIAAPIVIVGPARSGTTRLQRMLAADARFQHLKAWEGFNPAPLAGLPEGGRRIRRDEAGRILRLRRKLFPGADTTHPMDPDWAEEEILLLDHAFGGLSTLLFYPWPTYCRWFLDQDRSDAYRSMADTMRLVSWARGDAEDKPWIMKTPQHMLDLDALLEVFPDARVVFIHRDPVKTVGSTLSLAWHLAVQNTDRPCRGAVRDVWLGLCEQMARRCIRVRDGLPATRQLDIHYGDMNRDWRGVMRRIYEHCGIEFLATAEQAMADWLARSERENRHGGHRYALADYGISHTEVNDRMKFYRDKYGVPNEEKPCPATA